MVKNLSFLIVFALMCSCSILPHYEEPADATPPADEGVPILPQYTGIPHPAGYDLSDIRVIFEHPTAPKNFGNELALTCDEALAQLMQKTSVADEIQSGARELVSRDPEGMHWCFYSKVLKLNQTLQSQSSWKTREHEVLTTFKTLAPISNAFFSEFKDSRYLRWAATYYSKVSEWVFFRKVDPTPESTLLLTVGTRTSLEPAADLHSAGRAPASSSIYDRYGISLQPVPAEVPPSK
jgi:hypothetical protein